MGKALTVDQRMRVHEDAARRMFKHEGVYASGVERYEMVDDLAQGTVMCRALGQDGLAVSIIGPYRCDDHILHAAIHEAEVEVLSEDEQQEEETKMQEFEVGDRVRVSDAGPWHGSCGTVRGRGGFVYQVRLDCGEVIYGPASYYEPLPHDSIRAGDCVFALAEPPAQYFKRNKRDDYTPFIGRTGQVAARDAARAAAWAAAWAAARAAARDAARAAAWAAQNKKLEQMLLALGREAREGRR